MRINVSIQSARHVSFDQLHSLGWFTAYVGDIHWDNYVIEFDLADLRYPSDLRILIRGQSSRNYMGLYLYRHYSNNCRFKWLIAREGKEQEIVNTDTDIFDYSSGCAGHYRIEALRNMYKVSKNGDQKVVFTKNNFSKEMWV